MIASWLVYLQTMPWELAGQLALSALLGGLVGLEREWTAHPAGLRTTMLVTIGSCLFTILSIGAFPVKGNAQDTARIAAQIVTGVGFLGAGALFQSHGRVKGLTTAATIWMVAAIGMACGTGMYFLAIFSTLLIEVVLIVLKPLSDLLERRAKPRSRGTKKPTGVAQRTPAGQPQIPRDDLGHAEPGSPR